MILDLKDYLINIFNSYGLDLSGCTSYEFAVLILLATIVCYILMIFICNFIYKILVRL